MTLLSNLASSQNNRFSNELVTGQTLVQSQVKATDDDLGTVLDFIVDEKEWKIRYINLNLSKWFSSRQVLISPELLSEPSLADVMTVNYPLQTIREAPNFENKEFLTREDEKSFYDYYNKPPYWIKNLDLDPGQIEQATVIPVEPDNSEMETPDDNKLNSFYDINWYTVSATDKKVGSIKDVIIDTSLWKVEYFIVDIGSFLNNKYVLISPYWIKQISWKNKTVVIDMPSDLVISAPTFSTLDSLSFKDEIKLRKHFQKC